MNRFFTLLCSVAFSAAAMATDYTDTIKVTVNGNSTTQSATISVDKQTNGKYTFNLRNFILKAGNQQIPVGNVTLTDVDAYDINSVNTLYASKNIRIARGDLPGVTWMGPMLSEKTPIPVQMVAEQRDNSLYAVININMKSLGQVIQVTFGKGYEIQNGGFENYRTESFQGIVGAVSGEEPYNWHSFLSASGDKMIKQLGVSKSFTYVSDNIRPGSAGTHSVLLTSVDFGGIIANGTITTGRLNMGNMLPTDNSNHASLDISNTATDSHGDPFYTLLNGRPDSLSVWVKFKQETPNTQYPYATVSAVITDGTYYQEPLDKKYDNIMAEARNRYIESNNNEWQRISIPFEYNYADNINGKAILVTVSTNASPGEGGGTDSLYIDDMELVYNQNVNLSGVYVKNTEVTPADTMKVQLTAADIESLTANDIKVYAANTNAKVINTSFTKSNGGATAEYIVYSNDLKSNAVYRIEIADIATGIESINSNDARQAAGIYTTDGRRVSTMKAGRIYIVRTADGKVTKIAK